MFTLGLLTGIALSILVFVIEIYLNQRNLGGKKLEQVIMQKTMPKGAVIMPPKPPVVDQVLKILE